MSALASYAPVAWLAGNVFNQPVYPTGGILIVASIALTLVVFRLLRSRFRPQRAFASVVALTVCFWNWDSLQASIGDIPTIATSSLLILLIVAATWFNAGSRYFELFVGISAITLLVVSGGLLAFRYTLMNLEKPVVIVEAVPLVGPDPFTPGPPDIHIVILDGYARSDVLDLIFEFDNYELESELVESGFQISDKATANYSITHFSIPSLLQSDYVARSGAMVGPADLVRLRDVMSGRNSTIETLRQFGYSFIQGDSAWWGSRCGADADYCIEAAAIDETVWNVLRGTPASSSLSSRVPGIDISRERLVQFSNWDATASEWPPGPTFSFFHIPLPHPPYLLDANCNFRAETDRRSATDIRQSRDLYVEQLGCANRLIRALTTQVGREDLVVIMSDHGPDTGRFTMVDRQDWELALFERMSIFLAIRLPPQCADQGVAGDLVTVNVMRVVMNCAIEANLPMLEARHYLPPSAGERGQLTEIVDPDLRPTGSSFADRSP